jgi:hypothetical protein
VNFRDACSAFATSQIKVQSGWAELPEEARHRYRYRSGCAHGPFKEFGGKGLTEYWEEFPRKH